MSRKARKIIPPVSVSTEPVVMDYQATTADEYKQLTEREYVPVANVERKPMRTFFGCGVYLPKIDGKDFCVSFENGNKFSTDNEGVIDYCVKKGFKEVE